MSTPRKVLLQSTALAAACVALAPGVAHAATPAHAQRVRAALSGTVVGRPTVAGQSVVVPVLLSSAGERTAGTALARVVAPKTGGLRASTGRLKPLDLRIGDRVTASVSRVTARLRVRVLRVTRRAGTPSFARMDGQKRTVTAGVTTAIGQAKKILDNPTSVLDPANPAASNFALREQLRAVRTDLNLLIADLRLAAGSFDTTVAQIVAARPKDAARAAVAARRQRATLDALSADAAGGRDAAKALDEAVARLDEEMNAVGQPSAEPLPIDGLAGVSNLLYQVLDLLRGPEV